MRHKPHWRQWYKRWQSITAAEKRLFLEAFLAVGAARIAIKLFTFQRLKSHLGTPLQSHDIVPLSPATHDQLARIGLNIRRAAKVAPWHAMCYEQALAARWMLVRRGYRTTLYIGMRKSPDGALQGHAWLRVGDHIVTGDQQLTTYTVVGTFVAG